MFSYLNLSNDDNHVIKVKLWKEKKPLIEAIENGDNVKITNLEVRHYTNSNGK